MDGVFWGHEWEHQKYRENEALKKQAFVLDEVKIGEGLDGVAIRTLVPVNPIHKTFQSIEDKAKPERRLGKVQKMLVDWEVESLATGTPLAFGDYVDRLVDEKGLRRDNAKVLVKRAAESELITPHKLE